MPRSVILITLRLAILLLCAGAAFSQAATPADIKSSLDKAAALKYDGKDADAGKIYESLLPQLRAAGPSQQLTEVLGNLADIADTAGEYDRALDLAHEGVQVCRKLGDIGCEAKSHNDAGLAYLNAGEYPEAASELETALTLSTRAGDALTSVLVLNNLGNVDYYLAKYSEALRSYESAAALVEKSSGEWTISWRKVTRLNLATLYQRVGNYQRAISIYYDELNKPHGLSVREIAHVLANLGILYRRLGDAPAALKNYHDAETWYAQQKDTDGELGVIKNIGIVLGLDLGRLQDALKTFDRAHSLAEKTGNQREIMQALLYRAETLYRMDRLPQAEKDFEAARNYAVQLGTAEEQWKALYGMGKIAVRNGRPELAEQRFRAAIENIESLRSKLQLSRLKTDFLADKRDVYDALIKLLLERNDLPDALEYMERSRARVFQDRFYSAKLTPASLSLSSLQARLGPDTALIEFWTGSDAVAAVWVTRDSAGITQKRFSPAQMDNFEQEVSGLPGNLQQDWQASFKKIGSVIPDGIAPLRQHQYKHLLIVPDGFLSLFPFELMADASGSPLLEYHDITYMPSAVLLLRRAREIKRIRFPWQEELVAFGDPSVVGAGESSLLAAKNGETLQALPSSGDEIRAIAAMSAGRTKLYLTQSDQKASFFASAQTGAPLLHVSTHAIADMDNPERSRLLFSPDEPGEPNNFLFLKELYDLDLRGVSLATLSACDTERGRLVPGEGVQAFSRALLAAGSLSALTTLWRVPDQPTAEFMERFYFFLLKQHKSKAEALRLTKLEFLRSGTELSHPRFWAAFVLNGDGTEPVPRFIPWQAMLSPLLVIAAIALLFFQFKKRKIKTDLRHSKTNAVHAEQ
ncbi:MAG TPA: CHAT domain-containing protein [Candidatus Angelobacter sp.]|nr:CHAT domain-containing protein [Candidatus Angelobacter sp.]